MAKRLHSLKSGPNSVVDRTHDVGVWCGESNDRLFLSLTKKPGQADAVLLDQLASANSESALLNSILPSQQVPVFRP